VARILAKCDGWQDPLAPHVEQASRVFAFVVSPLLDDIRDLRWLIAEAERRLEMERLAHTLTIAARDEAQVAADRLRFERDAARAAAPADGSVPPSGDAE
jgi:hypothetical protein